MGKTQSKKVQAEETKDVKQAEPQGEQKIKKRKVDIVRLYVRAPWNNTFVSATDNLGNVLFRFSTGQLGFKGNRKSTPFAGSRVATAAMEKLKGFEVSEFHIYVKGVGPGRDSTMKTLFSRDLPIAGVYDLTPVAFGGPRPVKIRRT